LLALASSPPPPPSPPPSPSPGAEEWCQRWGAARLLLLLACRHPPGSGEFCPLRAFALALIEEEEEEEDNVEGEKEGEKSK
jgi:hypothetical protein